MKRIYSIIFVASFIISIVYTAQKPTETVSKNPSAEEQKKRDEDAQKYRNMVEALGGKHLEHKPISQSNDHKAKL